MRFLKNNDGFTLVELIVTIVVGSIVTMAATTVLILGLRIYNNANTTALKQNEVQIGITVIENLVAEAEITHADSQKVSAATGDVLVYDSTNQVLETGAGVEILSKVTGFDAKLVGQLVSFEISFEDITEPYEFSVFCRLAEIDTTSSTDASEDPSTPVTPSEGESAVSFSLSRTPDVGDMLTAAVEDDTLTPHVRAFLKVLDSQRGSTGRIQTENGEGAYYSEWYIGGYADNPNWSSETPWCACFVSWVLEQCSGYIEGETPRYANVDTFWVDLVTTQNWKTENPKAGDLIFFDWIVDDAYNPQHVGVVIAADDSRVYTIEGNVNGRVTLCSYALEDDRILGYGLLNWTK